MISFILFFLVLCKCLSQIIKIALAYLQNMYISLKFNATVNLILTLIRFIVTIIDHFFPSDFGFYIKSLLNI
jgi:hypothetical protein